MNHPVGKHSGAGKQEHGRESQPLFDFHFVKDMQIEGDQRKVEENRQHSVGVIVKVPILAGPQTEVTEDLVTAHAYEERKQHV
jgi:hypothetical protein